MFNVKPMIFFLTVVGAIKYFALYLKINSKNIFSTLSSAAVVAVG